ncbi:hypothetical protein F1880_005218 [Penicillium rolfsii]|nr:hypothetical protein F1880_005218 [Penicillium rolfsii]
MPFCSLLKKSQFASSRQRRRDSKLPLMDLSSLEGPPLAEQNPRVVISVDNESPRIQQEPPTPESASHYPIYHNLYTKPLPPRPASADPLNLRQSRHSISHNRMDNSHTKSSLSDSHLRRVPAQRGRRSSHELRPGEGIAAADPVRDACSRSPSVNAYLQPEYRVPRRPRSAPLAWSEEEELLVVSGRSSSSHWPSTRQTRLPQLDTHLNVLSLRSEDPVDGEQDHDAHSPPPPLYDSHGFSHTHVVRQQRGGAESRWGAVARRLHDLSNG